MDTGSFTGVKRPGRGFDHPPTSKAEVKERIDTSNPPLGLRGLCYGELYLTLAFWRLLKITELGWNAKLTFTKLFLSTVMPSSMSALRARKEESYLPHDMFYSQHKF
jgi:hypothetical protein